MKPLRRSSFLITPRPTSYDGEAGFLAYNAGKAGLRGIVRTAAGELGPNEIRVDAFCPDLIRLRLAEALFRNPSLAKPYFQLITPGRRGTPSARCRSGTAGDIPYGAARNGRRGGGGHPVPGCRDGPATSAASPRRRTQGRWPPSMGHGMMTGPSLRTIAGGADEPLKRRQISARLARAGSSKAHLRTG